MLASVLRSKKAIDMNIAIVRTFMAMRYFANSNKELFEQIIDLRKEMQTILGSMTHNSQLFTMPWKICWIKGKRKKKRWRNGKREKR